MSNTSNFRTLPFESITVKEGFNIRQDYGDIETLAESILANGIKVPLRGYAKGANFVITDGHRRHAAVTHLRQQGKGLNIKIPFLLEEKGYTEEKRTFDLILLNDGKKLTLMEEAALYQRIKTQFGLNNVEIAKKAGKSSMHVGNCLLLLDAPQELQDYILQGVVSASLVIDQLRIAESGEVVLDNIKQALESQLTTEGEPKKVSKKHIEGVKSEKTTTPKAKVEITSTETPTQITIDTNVLTALVSELSEFDDMSSLAASNTLKFIMQLGTGELDKNAFINKMLNNLID